MVSVGGKIRQNHEGGNENAKTKCLIFDSYYDNYKGAVAYVRVMDGTVKVGDEIELMATKKTFTVAEVGYFIPGSYMPTSEIKAGEGKSIIASLPAYLNALDGKGVHIVTTNEYLAKRDYEAAQDRGETIPAPEKPTNDGFKEYVHREQVLNEQLIRERAELALAQMLESTPDVEKKAVAIAAYDIVRGDVQAEFAGAIPEEIATELKARGESIGGIGTPGLTVSLERKNTVGVCAEFRSANMLLLRGSKIENIRFTDAIRPRNGRIIPTCPNCRAIFPEAFGGN